MNSFGEEIVRILGEELYSLTTYKYSVFGSHAVAIEGHKGLRRFSRQSITLSLGKRVCICVKGDHLTIKQMTADFCLITGVINGVEVDNE